MPPALVVAFRIATWTVVALIIVAFLAGAFVRTGPARATRGIVRLFRTRESNASGNGDERTRRRLSA
jgi:hypothetical protein